MANTQTRSKQGQGSGENTAFFAWAKDQMDALDRQFQDVSNTAQEKSADISGRTQQQWEDARAAVGRQRKQLAARVKEQTAATQSELRDIETATKRSIADLGDKVEEFRRMVGHGIAGDGKSKSN